MKRIFSLLALLAVILPMEAQLRINPPKLSDPNSFSLVVIGDPQGYTKYAQNQPLFELTAAWCAYNVKPLNIKGVLITGDLVEQNETVYRKRTMLDQTSRQMYEWASHCLERLDNRVPYFLCGGNHEYGFVRGDEGFTHIPDYYPIERNSYNMESIVSNYPNRDGRASVENAAWEIEAPNWGKLLVINFEFAPRDEVLDWAKNLCASDAYKNHKVIVLTHTLLRPDNSYTDNESYKLQPRNWGKQMWEKLIYPSSNIRLAVCGHTGSPSKEPGSLDDFEKNTGYRCDKNVAGKDVHQMLFNIQCLGGGWEGNGGDGWVRILEFMPDGKTIKASTYSVLFGVSPVTAHLAYQTDPCCKFEMVIE